MEITLPTIESNVYDDGYLRVEHENYFVACEGHTIKLPRAEFLVISRLARTAERIVPSEELWNNAWEDSKPFNAVSMHVYMYRLRRKLIPYGISIETMVNVGYRLMPRNGGQGRGTGGQGSGVR